MTHKNTLCLWYNGSAEEAAKFYANTFPDSAVNAAHRAPADYPSGKRGDVLTVEFTVLGIPCIGLNGGPVDKKDAIDKAVGNEALNQNTLRKAVREVHASVKAVEIRSPYGVWGTMAAKL